MIDDLYNVGDEYASVCAIAKYDIAKELITELIYLDIDPISIHIDDPDVTGYDKEFIVRIDEEGLWCDELYDIDGERYLNIYSSVVYLHEDCKSAIIKHIYTDSDRVFEFAVGDDDLECDGNCDNCDLIKAKHDNAKAKETNNNSFNITAKLDLDADEALKVLKDVEIRIDRLLTKFDNLFR